MIAGYKAKATATYSFSSNATNQCNTTHQNAHSHKWVDEPATKKKKKKHQLHNHITASWPNKISKINHQSSKFHQKTLTNSEEN